MSTRDFMHAVWPDEGFYCIALPFRGHEGNVNFQHSVFETIDEALDFVEQKKHARDIYFAVLSLRQREYFNATKINPKTGEPGVMQTRVGPNMLAARSFFFDIDAGPGKPYATANDAVAALVEFTNTADLPKPTLVSSGYGLHAYWIIDHAIHVDKWQPIEGRLKQLAIHHGLQIDPSRTTDSTSLLRVPGTSNRKDPLEPRPVTLWKQVPELNLDDFAGKLEAAAIRAGLGAVSPLSRTAAPPSGADILGSNITKTFDGPPVTLKQVGEVCAQVRAMVDSRGNLDQPAWYQGLLGTVKWVADGHAWCHKISSGAPSYTAAETDAKLAQLDSFGPSSCATIASVMPEGESKCRQCPFFNKVPNPLVAARKYARVELQQPQHLVMEDDDAADAPGLYHGEVEPPSPYRLTSSGVVKAIKLEGQDKTEELEIIHPYHIRPVRRLRDPAEGVEIQEWLADLPREGRRIFPLQPNLLYDPRSLSAELARNGVYLNHNHIGSMVEYMTAYIQLLQQQRDAETQVTHMGWTKNFDGFILPGRIVTATGSDPTGMAPALEQRVEAIRTSGTMEAQVELMRFYNDDRYIPNQIAILASLAAPLFHMTGHHGVVVNASGDTGASKSTTVYAASSAWGHPTEYTLNGTNNGATALARDAKVDAYANLAVTLDEITYMSVKDIQNLVMGITQPQGRLRLKKDGSERRQAGGHKSTILIASANSSIHGILSNDNAAGTAGSMRVLEMTFRKTGVHTKPEADQFLRGLKENYGHLGPKFIEFVLQNYEKVKQRVHQVMAEIDTEGNVEPSERFISGVFAVVLVAAEIAKALRLLDYDAAKIRRHMLDVELPHHRGIVTGEYSTPLSILADYIQIIHGNTIVLKPSVLGGRPAVNVTTVPHGALLAHIDQAVGELVLLKKGFKDYCSRTGANMSKIIDELSRPRPGGPIIVESNAKRTIGSGTDYAVGQSWCVVVNLNHPDIASKMPPTQPGQVHHLHAVS